MRNLRRDIVSLALIVTAFAFSAALYPRLPERLPTHWNIQGQPDGFTGKFAMANNPRLSLARQVQVL